MSPNIKYYRINDDIYTITPNAKKHDKIEVVSPLGNGEYYNIEITFEDYLLSEFILTNNVYKKENYAVEINGDKYIYRYNNKTIQCSYKNNKLHGTFTETNGFNILVCNYNNGELHGEFEKKSFNNSLFCYYNNGKLHGRYIKTNINVPECYETEIDDYREYIEVDCNYNNGILEGDYYCNNDYIFTIGKYENNELTDVVIDHKHDYRLCELFYDDF